MTDDIEVKELGWFTRLFRKRAKLTYWLDQKVYTVEVIDTDADGKVSKEDLEKSNELLELELREEKADAHRRMAWVAIISMIVFTAVLFSPVVSESRVAALADLLGLFYIAQASIVGAFMGVTAGMSRK